THPAIDVTVRSPGGPPGQMQGERLVKAGGGSQMGLFRWGDYSAMTVDPVGDVKFWYTTEYIPADGSFNWATRIASFVLPPPPTLSLSTLIELAVPQGGSGTVPVVLSGLGGFSGDAVLSGSGAPSGAT